MEANTGAGAGLGVEPGVRAAEEAADSRSLLDRVKARRDSMDDLLTLDVPSWDGGLKAKYEVVEREDLEKMVRKINSRQRQRQNGTNVGTEADLDFLIKACVSVVAFDAESGEEEEVSDGFNRTLAEKLGDPEGSDSARGLLLYLTRQPDGRNNTIAIGALALRVARWMQDTSKSVEDPQ